MTQDFAATSGSAWTGNVDLTWFTRGQIQVNATGYGVDCASISGATPTWVADPVDLYYQPGTSGRITLNFRQNSGIVASGNFLPSVAEVSVGVQAIGLRLVDGTIKTFGNLMSLPLTDVAQLVIGDNHACVRKNDGTVWCWGNNTFGQLGNNTFADSWTSAVQVVGISDVKLIAAGSFTTCASTRTATYCWGRNQNSAIGDGTTTNRNTPQQVYAYASSAIATSWYHTCASRSDGQAYCWGNNTFGQLGNGGTQNSPVPVLVGAGLRGLTSIAVGVSHSCGVDSDNKAYCWGLNSSGQFGTGVTTNSSTPVPVKYSASQLVNNAAEIVAGATHTCFRTIWGEAYCHGGNGWGSVGDGSGVNQLFPVLLSAEISQIRANSGASTCALVSGVSVFCWGDNSYGIFNDGTLINRYTPMPVPL